MSGTILVDDETRHIESTNSLTEVVEQKRNIRQAERPLVDTNMLLNLPDKVSYIFTNQDIPKPSLVSHLKVNKQTLVTADQHIESAQLKEVKSPIIPEHSPATESEKSDRQVDDTHPIEPEDDFEIGGVGIEKDLKPTPQNPISSAPTLTPEETEQQLDDMEKEMERLS